MAKKKKKVSRFRAAKGGEGLLKRTEEAYANRGSSGKFKNYIKDGVDVEQYKPKNGDHIFDIIPYLAGKNNPNVVEGSPTYKLDLWVHKKIGPQENDYICLAQNFNNPCPICEYIARLKKEEDDYDDVDNSSEISDIKCKRRVLYNIIVYNTPQEEQKGVQLFEASHYLVEKGINAVSKIKRTGGFIPFSDPDKGKTIECTKEGERKSTKYVGFTLTEREESITEEMLDNALILDEIIEVFSYDELTELAQFDMSEEEETYEDEPAEDELPEEEEYEEEPVAEEEEYEDEDNIDPDTEKYEEEYEDEEETSEIPEDDIPFEKEDEIEDEEEEPTLVTKPRLRQRATSSKNTSKKDAPTQKRKARTEKEPTQKRKARTSKKASAPAPTRRRRR